MNIKIIISTLVLIVLCTNFVYADLSDYPNFFFRGDTFNGFIVIGVDGNSEDVISGIHITSGLVYLTDEQIISGETREIGEGVAITESEVEDPYGRNLILIGNPCYNKLSSDFMGNPSICTDNFNPGEAIIKLYNYNGKHQLLVAGYSSYDTRVAASVLREWYKYDLKGTEVRVKGTINNPIVFEPEVDIEEEEQITFIYNESEKAEIQEQENESPSESVVEPEEKSIECNGCMVNQECLVHGTRIVVEESLKYCDESKSLVDVREDGEQCVNHYECRNNMCEQGACYIEVQPVEKGFVERIIDFFRRLFGR